MQHEQAENTAIQALGFLAGDHELMTRFLRLTGIEPENIRLAAREPAFLAGVLTFLMQDERLLTRFASENDLRVEAVAKAHRTLAGTGAYDIST